MGRLVVPVLAALGVGCPSSHSGGPLDLGSDGPDLAPPVDSGPQPDALLGQPCPTNCYEDHTAEEWPNGILTSIGRECIPDEGRFRCASYIREPYYSYEECGGQLNPPDAPGRFCTCRCGGSIPPEDLPPGTYCECPADMVCEPMEYFEPEEITLSYCVPRELVP